MSSRRDFCKAVLPAAAALSAASSSSLLVAADLPRDAPDLVVMMPGGRSPIRLSQFKGKVVAVEFLLTYCSHCQRASRTSEILYRELGPKGFQVIGAAINPGGDVLAYQRDFGLTFPVGTVTQDTCLWFLQHPAMLRLLMPQAAFIDRNFKIVQQYAGDNPFFGESEEKNMRDLVTKLLAQGAGAPAKKAPAKKKKAS